jgi:hypothetical protein
VSCPKPCSPSLGCQSCIPRQPSIYEHPFHGMLRHPYFAGMSFSVCHPKLLFQF